MKKIFIVTFITITINLFLLNCIFCQLDLVKENLDHPTAIDFHNNRAYVAIQGNAPNTGKIISFDLDNPGQTTIVHFEDLSSYPRSLIVIGDNLYIGFTTYIGKIDLSMSTLTLEVFNSNVSFPRSFVHHDNKLIIAENNKISYIDLLSLDPDPIVIVPNLPENPLSMAKKDTNLYFGSGSEISKIDLTNTSYTIESFFSDLPINIYAISILGQDLYVEQTYEQFPGSKIVKLNLDDPNNTLETNFDDTGGIIDINHINGVIYLVSHRTLNGSLTARILKARYPVLTKVENQIITDVIAYPNPTNCVINIRGLNNKNCKAKIYDSYGKFIKQESKLTNISMENLDVGIYYIQVLNEASIVSKMIKVVKTEYQH